MQKAAQKILAEIKSLASDSDDYSYKIDETDRLQLPNGRSYHPDIKVHNGTSYQRIAISCDKLDFETWMLLELCGFGEHEQYEHDSFGAVVVYTRGHPDNDEPENRSNVLPVIDCR